MAAPVSFGRSFGATEMLTASATASREHQQRYHPKDRQADCHLDGIQALEVFITARAVSPARPEARVAGMPRAVELATLRASTNRRWGAEIEGRLRLCQPLSPLCSHGATRAPIAPTHTR